MKQGDVVFFKKAKSSLSFKAPEIGFKGQAWGILMGMIPPFLTLPPTKNVVFQCLGAIGMVSFDDVSEFLGEEQAAIVVEKFKQKYTNPQIATQTKSKILGLNGDAIETTGEKLIEPGTPDAET